MAEHDARTGLINGATASNAPFVPDVGIHINHILSPSQGWPVALYCPICKETTIVLSQWSIRPNDGDYWHINNVCGSDVLGDRHNIEMSCNSLIAGRGKDSPMFIYQEMTIEEAKRRFPHTPIAGQD